MRAGVLTIMIFAMLLSACGTQPKTIASVPASKSHVQVKEMVQDMEEKGNWKKDLENQLNQSGMDPKSFFQKLTDSWYPEHSLDRVFIEKDLNHDGSIEVIGTLNPTDKKEIPTGKLYIASKNGDSYSLSFFPEEDTVPIRTDLIGVHALDEDANLEIVWQSMELGFAHTPWMQIHILKWPQPVEDFTVSMANIEKVIIENKQLKISGGLVQSVGAGMEQRRKTEIYQVELDGLRLTDSFYEPSNYGYHLFIDGLLAEELGKSEEAIKLYKKSLIADQLVVEPKALQIDKVTGDVNLEIVSDAFQSLTRFRLAKLLIAQHNEKEAKIIVDEANGQFKELPSFVFSARANLPQKVEGWAIQNPLFIKALNAPFGYANPKWRPESLCLEWKQGDGSLLHF